MDLCRNKVCLHRQVDKTGMEYVYKKINLSVRIHICVDMQRDEQICSLGHAEMKTYVASDMYTDIS